MAKKLNQILVLDVEATCWSGEPPPGQKKEIIEVGLCLLDTKTLKLSGKRSILVRPNSEVSPFCTSLTTLTQADVDTGIPFRSACKILEKEYNAPDIVMASYGDYDRMQFARECTSGNIRNPFGPTHLNVKNLVALVLGLDREVGMPTALEMLKLPMEGTHHRGVDDSFNIAKILANILQLSRK